MTGSPPPKQPRIGYRTSGDDMMEFLTSGAKMGATRMDRTTAPGWYAALEEMSAKIGVHPPALYRVPTHRINAGMAFDALVLTDGLLKLGGCAHTDPRPSKEVMMIMAHDLGHHKQGAKMILAARALPFALPLAAMAGLFIYDRIYGQNKEHTPEELKEAIDRTTGEEIDRMKEAHKAAPFDDEQTRQVNSAWKEGLIQVGRYALVGALGLGVGLVGTRSLMRHLEFDADRVATLVSGDAKGYIHCLEKLHGKGSKQFTAELAKKPELVHTGEQIHDFIAREFKKLIGRTFHAHPSMEERKAAILAVEKSKDFQSLVAKTVGNSNLLL